MTSLRIGFQPASFAIDGLSAYPTTIWLASYSYPSIALKQNLIVNVMRNDHDSVDLTDPRTRPCS